MGSVYIPRHAEIGSIIGEFNKFGTPADENRSLLRCTNDGSVNLDFTINAVRAISPVLLPPVNGEDVNGKVIETNISGVGAYYSAGLSFAGGATNAFTPMGPPVIPFTAIHNQRMSVEFSLTRLSSRVTLIKTGDITPGPAPWMAAHWQLRPSQASEKVLILGLSAPSFKRSAVSPRRR